MDRKVIEQMGQLPLFTSLGIRALVRGGILPAYCIFAQPTHHVDARLHQRIDEGRFGEVGIGHHAQWSIPQKVLQLPDHRMDAVPEARHRGYALRSTKNWHGLICPEINRINKGKHM